MSSLPYSGVIEPETFPPFVADLHKTGATGSLKVEGGAYRKALYFRNGRILFGSSNDPRDQLGAILIASGKITQEQFESASPKVGPGNPLARVLSDSGMVGQKDLSEAARTKVERIVADVLTSTSGTYEFEDGVLPKGAVDLRLSTPRLFLDAARSRFGSDAVARCLGPQPRALRLAGDAETVLGELGPEVAEFGRAMDGHASIAQVASIRHMDADDAERVGAALVLLGLLLSADIPASREPHDDAETERFDPFTLLTDSPSTDTFQPFSVTPPAAPKAGTTAAFGPQFEEPTLTAEPANIVFDAPKTVILSTPEPPPFARAETVVPQTAETFREISFADTVSPTSETPAPLPPSEPTIVAAPRQPAPPPRPSPPSGPVQPASPPPLVSAEAPRMGPRPRGGPSGLVKAVAAIGGVAIVGSALWYRLGPSTPAPQRTVAVATPTTVSTPIGLPTAPLEAPTATPAAIPPSQPTVLPTPMPATAAPSAAATSEPRRAPAATPEPSPARRETPRPTPPRETATGASAAGALLKEGRIDEAARAFEKAMARRGFTVQLLVACSEETVTKAVANAGGDALTVLPLRFKGRDCYRLVWGRYATEGDAEAALTNSVPAYYRAEASKPRVIAVSTIFP